MWTLDRRWPDRTRRPGHGGADAVDRFVLLRQLRQSFVHEKAFARHHDAGLEELAIVYLTPARHDGGSKHHLEREEWCFVVSGIAFSFLGSGAWGTLA